jgi:hypothetical protein
LLIFSGEEAARAICHLDEPHVEANREDILHVAPKMALRLQTEHLLCVQLGKWRLQDGTGRGFRVQVCGLLLRKCYFPRVNTFRRVGVFRLLMSPTWFPEDEKLCYGKDGEDPTIGWKLREVKII